MSDAYQGGPQTPAQGSAGGTDIVTALQGIIRQITAGNTGLAALTAAVAASFPPLFYTGACTLSAGVATVVANGNVTTSSAIFLFPTNAAAGTLIGSAKSLYISAKTAGVSFEVSTANAVAAAGTETFVYLIVSP